jgi:hypothetical protein
MSINDSSRIANRIAVGLVIAFGIEGLLLVWPLIQALSGR